MLTWWYSYTTVNNKTTALIADTCSTPRRRIQHLHAGSSASRCVFLRAARKNFYLLTISAVCFSTSPCSCTVRLCSASSAVFLCRPAKHQLCFLHINSPSRESGIVDIFFPPEAPHNVFYVGVFLCWERGRGGWVSVSFFLWSQHVNKHIGVVLIVDTCSWWVHMLVT